MSKFFKNFFHGFGSVLDIWPDSRHQDYYIRHNKSVDDALRKNWESVGGYLSSAMNTYSHEQEKVHEEEKQIAE